MVTFDTDYNDDAFLTALKEVYRKMLERKARLGEMVHTADVDGVMRTQRAIDVYNRVYGELPPLYN